MINTISFNKVTIDLYFLCTFYLKDLENYENDINIRILI